MNTINLGVCSPSQVININIAVNDFSLLEFYNNNIVLNNEELEWSYSTDNVGCHMIKLEIFYLI